MLRDNSLINLAIVSSLSLFNLTVICCYLLLRSMLEKTLDPCNSLSISSNRKMENLYLMVMLFMALESTHVCQVRSFLGTKRVGNKHRVELFLMYPRSSNSWTCYCSSFDSLGLHLQADFLGKGTPGKRSIWCSITLKEGSSKGRSLGNISSNSLKND